MQLQSIYVIFGCMLIRVGGLGCIRLRVYEGFRFIRK